MQRIWLAITVTALVVLVGYGTYQALRTEEARIRAVLREAAESFNSSNLASCLAAFDPEYRDPGPPTLTKGTLTQVLRYLFVRRIDATGRFTLRVAIQEDGPTVELQEGPDQEGPKQAVARFRLRLEEFRRGRFELAWEVQVEARLHRVDGDWRIHSSSYETTAGRRPR